jgi:hypothetical protein
MEHIAYLDPGTSTLIVQAVLGGAAGAAVLFKTKGRRLFKRNKSEESDQEPVQDETDDPTARTAPAD